MIVSTKWLSNFKSTYALYAVVAYGLFTSVRDFFYLQEIFSCTEGFNMCQKLPMAEVLTNSYLVHTLFIVKGVLFLTLLSKSLRKVSLAAHIVILMYFFFINRVFYTPEMAYLHFLFFCLLFSPEDNNTFFPSYIFKPFETVVYLSYTFSGYFKMNSIYWMDGTFLNRFLGGNQVVLPWLDGINLNFSILYYLSFIVLSMELFAFMALFNRYFKVFFWTGLTFMHLAIFVTTDLTEVSFGMLVVHLFLIDERIVEFYTLIKRGLFGIGGDHLKAPDQILAN